MKTFIVIDKQEGFSWLNTSLDEVLESTGFDNLDSLKGEYEVIEIEGDFKIDYLID